MDDPSDVGRNAEWLQRSGEEEVIAPAERRAGWLSRGGWVSVRDDGVRDGVGGEPTVN